MLANQKQSNQRSNSDANLQFLQEIKRDPAKMKHANMHFTILNFY